MSTDAATTAVGGRRLLLHAIFDLSRTRQALLSVAQPALGAVIALGGLPTLRQMALGLVAATTGFLAVFSLNDVLDERVDKMALAAGKAEFVGFDLDTVYSRHPIAGGQIPLRVALAWVGGLAVVSATIAYVLHPICLLLFGVAVALEVLYCLLRSVTWAKTFVSGAMVAVGGLAGWVAVAPLSARAIPLAAFLAVWEIAGRNIPNDLSDVDADARTGIRTVATTYGGRTAARATLAGAVVTIGALRLFAIPAWADVVLLLTAFWAMLLPAISLVGKPSSEQAGAYFNRASLLPALVFPIVVIALELAL